MTWRDTLPVHPATELFPRMSEAELRELGEDIRKHGLKVPIVVWKDQKNASPELLDGRNRLDAIEAAGLAIEIVNIGPELDPSIRLWAQAGWQIETVEVRGDQPGGDPYAYVVSANIHRRHLTPEQRRELIAKLLIANPGKSNRQIARQTKADHKTVAAVRQEQEGRGEIPHVEKRKDTKGRMQPAAKPWTPPPVRSQAVKDAAKKADAVVMKSVLEAHKKAEADRDSEIALRDFATAFESPQRETQGERRS
jgi:hypothetical protein